MDFRNGCFDHKLFNAYNENIMNATKSRLKWTENYAKLDKKFPNKSLFSWRGMYDMLKLDEESQIKFKLPEINPPPRKIDYRKEADDYLKLIGAKDENLNIIPGDCYPINSEMNQMLYRNRNANRKEYLRERGKQLPEERYKFPMSSSMEYGWRIGTANKPNEINASPQFGVKNAIMGTLYRNNGIFN